MEMKQRIKRQQKLHIRLRCDLQSTLNESQTLSLATRRVRLKSSSCLIKEDSEVGSRWATHCLSTPADTTLFQVKLLCNYILIVHAFNLICFYFNFQSPVQQAEEKQKYQLIQCDQECMTCPIVDNICVKCAVVLFIRFTEFAGRPFH